MGGRALIVTLVGIMVLSTAIFSAITSTSQDIGKTADRFYFRQAALNIAQTGVNMGLRRLQTDVSFRSTGTTLIDMFGGQLSMRVVDTMFAGKGAIKIMCTGIVNQTAPNPRDVRRDTSIAYLPGGFVPAAVRAAITANNPVSTLGNLIVDGRDHTTDGNLIASQGTNAIWTTKTFSQGGNSKTGGTQGGIDYEPAKPANPRIDSTGGIWPGGYPTSPDSIIGGPAVGYPEGTLKAIAQSGLGGSQYVTNPAFLTTPLRGVTYVELPSGNTWQSMNIEGTGLLIVHNTTKNAAMKNLNSGTFVGLLIIDDPVHIHTDIIGAVVGLSPNPSEGNCIGNGNGSIRFSSKAVRDAIGSTIAPTGPGTGSGTNVVSWWE